MKKKKNNREARIELYIKEFKLAPKSEGTDGPEDETTGDICYMVKKYLKSFLLYSHFQYPLFIELSASKKG